MKKTLFRCFFGFFIKGNVGKIFYKLSYAKALKYLIWYYGKLGVKIAPPVVFISNDVYFDSAAYSEISIGKNVTISKEVSFLVHDYSIHMALVNIDRKPEKGIAHFISGISIGEDSFIGMRVTLLPGTQIGRNCIIGAGAVVKGIIPDNSIVIGNPAKVIGDTREWAERKFLEHNYLE